MTPLDPARLRDVRMLITDVDGVLTDGRIQFDHSGNEVKSFHVHDAAGIVYWHRAGGLTGFLSGRRARVVADRAAELGVHEVRLGHLDKLPVFEEMLHSQGVEAEEVACIGDDLLDLPMLARAGVSIAPANARPEVRERVHLVTQCRGGEGAVREVVELLLRARGAWDRIVARGGRP
ncbi:MAG: HAD hydrolase family protein [Planctomycetes bacterium]|nr:HAD hydrolase family protein [Planctomycetota bacterium]